MRLAGLAVVLFLAIGAQAQSSSNPCPSGKPVPAELTLPAQLPPGEPVAFEKQVLSYLSTLDYRKLGWCEDREVRDTGPFIQGFGATTHPPAHIYYSPGVSAWLVGGRKGEIPDGAAIIKEQFSPGPAARYHGIKTKDLGCSNDWTFMIKNSKASHDGWFWGEVWNSTTNPMDFNNKYQYPNAGYGLYCLRCHASAEKGLTFSSLSNIVGGPGYPLQYRVDDSWRSVPAQAPGACGSGPSPEDFIERSEFPAHAQNAAIEAEISVPKAFLVELTPAVQSMPPETWDDVVAPPAHTKPIDYAKSPELITSAQCLGCHSGLSTSPLGPSMVIMANASGSSLPASTLPDVNVSPYGEWRWSPMGLAGRDPVFFSQLDSETAFEHAEPAKQQLIVNTCMQCHGAMGKREFAAEHPGEPFKVDFVYETDQNAPGFKYGGLAREGISCEVCHRMAAPKDKSIDYFFAKRVNGIFDLTPPTEVHGPFQDAELTTYPMDTGMGVKPKYDAFIKSSQMCGSCHSILLPVLDSKDPNEKSVEQATYPEWLNSAFRNEYGSVGATPKTCQDCHMPGGYTNTLMHRDVPQLEERFAIVQDGTYPQAEHTGTPDQLNVRYRETGFVRHELLGLNGFLLQMFGKPLDSSDNNEVLGVRLPDYMTGFKRDLANASDNVVQQAQNATATVAISKWEVTGQKLIVEVTVTNLAGHRFPSGVGFRRAFLEMQAMVDGKTFWSSGTTDAMGHLTDANGAVLPTESFAGGHYQPHFSQSNPITNSGQVQIYEELMKNADYEFTTSFTRRDHPVKDNRLLPYGWSLEGPADLHIPEPYLDATHPVGDALRDPVYLAGKGQSIVRYEIPLPSGVDASKLNATVALYSQATPPYFLADRSQTKTPATARLEYLADQLGTLTGTKYASWKLLIAESKR